LVAVLVVTALEDESEDVDADESEDFDEDESDDDAPESLEDAVSRPEPECEPEREP